MAGRSNKSGVIKTSGSKDSTRCEIVDRLTCASVLPFTTLLGQHHQRKPITRRLQQHNRSQTGKAHEESHEDRSLGECWSAGESGKGCRLRISSDGRDERRPTL